MKFIVALVVLVAVVCSVNAAPRVPDARCPVDENEGSNVVLIPHESDCSKYWSCANSDAVEMKCPDDLWFNPKLKVCDWKDHVECNVYHPEQNNTTPIY